MQEAAWKDVVMPQDVLERHKDFGLYFIFTPFIFNSYMCCLDIAIHGMAMEL